MPTRDGWVNAESLGASQAVPAAIAQVSYSTGHTKIAGHTFSTNVTLIGAGTSTGGFDEVSNIAMSTFRVPDWADSVTVSPFVGAIGRTTAAPMPRVISGFAYVTFQPTFSSTVPLSTSLTPTDLIWWASYPGDAKLTAGAPINLTVPAGSTGMWIWWRARADASTPVTAAAMRNTITFQGSILAASS